MTLNRVADRTGWSFCDGSRCYVVYFRAKDVVILGSVKRAPFQKSTKPERLVCFCFEHSVQDVIRGTNPGSPSIRESIKAACKAGRDRCAVENPQGRCCLGNVGQVIHEHEGSGAQHRADCCATEETR